VVTSSDGTVTKTYTLVVTEAASANANLTSLKISKGVLSPAYNVNTTSYTASEPNTVSSITVTPTAVVSGSTIKVNGTAVTSGSASPGIPLFPGTNTITTVVTAQDGSTTKTYTIVVTEAASANASLSSLKASRGVLSPVFNPNTTSYTASVVNGATSTIITPTAAANGATIKVNGTTVASGSPSAPITLNVGANTITTMVTASDGTTTKTYTFTITRAGSPANIPDESLSTNQPAVSSPMDNDGIIVHPGISPNGDGINDFLVIDGILAYPDNKVSVINRNGALVFEAKGYDNASKTFDGHSNKTGQMQLPGTYFYQLEYTAKGIIKHKTGYLVLKY
jgi:gliding motility-associated-like protein